MRVVVLESSNDVALFSAGRIADALRRGSAGGGPAVIGTATGSSPLGTYRELAEMVRAEHVNTNGVRLFALDEYVGLDPAHPEGYHAVTHRTVTEPLGIDPALVRVPDGFASDLDAGCAEFERAIAEAGGIDLQLLGIGANGHIAFNEPGSSLDSRTRVAALAAETRDDNARFFASPEQVPTHCVTQGIGTILEARELLLVAHGEGKAAAVAAMIEGPVSSACPASVLQSHPRATVVIDRAAASLLRDPSPLHDSVLRDSGRVISTSR